MLTHLKHLCDACTLCSLGHSKHEVRGSHIEPHVFSNMQVSPYVIIGQNPGYHECCQGQPFVGQSGDNFNKEIAKHGLSRKNFYITNIVHCYTPKNRAPTRDELFCCHPLVTMEMLYIKPKLIVTLGKYPFNVLCANHNYSKSLGKKLISAIFGFPIVVFPLYHPSGQNLAIPERRKKFEQDIKTLAQTIEEFKALDVQKTPI